LERVIIKNFLAKLLKIRRGPLSKQTAKRGTGAPSWEHDKGFVPWQPAVKPNLKNRPIEIAVDPRCPRISRRKPS